MARTSKKAGSAPGRATGRDVVVVDGSNIATEGRSLPSLAQLNDAVTSFIEENRDAAVTVVVDATFGHRIDKKEVKAFDEAVANNELVTPPAGAVGRGDAFVLSIADKVGARVLSNDSFQEFHGDYPWLFDEGRLIGGKPVPNIGWVFVERVPVRGTRSRKSLQAAKAATSRSSASRASPSRSAQRAAAPASGASGGASADRKTRAPSGGDGSDTSRRTSQGDPVNDLLPFLEFVEKHPIGTSVNAEVESYSSHGAYAMVGDVRGYIPLALIDDPAPTSARKVMAIGEALTLVVASFSPSRRSIDLAYPHMAPSAAVDGVDGDKPADEKPAAVDGRRPSKRSAAKTSAAKGVASAPAASKKSATKRAAPAKKKTTSRKTASKDAVTKDAATDDASTKDAASTAPPADTASSTSTVTTAGETKTPARRAAAKKAPAKKAPATKTAAKKAPAKKSATPRSATTKAPAKSGSASKTGTSRSGSTARSRRTKKSAAAPTEVPDEGGGDG